MDVSYFDLHSVNFEVRYDHAYLYWDRAGLLWQAMRKSNPTLKLKEAVPAKVTMTIDERFQISVELDKVVIGVFTPPSNIDDYIPLCQQVLSLAASTLELTVFSRIGLRVFYRHQFRSSEEASDALFSTKIMKVPEGKHFGIEGQPKLPHYAMRWEGDKLGVQVNFRAQERKILVEGIMGETAVERVEKDLFELIFDVDYFTIGTVEVGQFRALDWIPNAMRVIRRDSKVFLEA